MNNSAPHALSTRSPQKTTIWKQDMGEEEGEGRIVASRSRIRRPKCRGRSWGGRVIVVLGSRGVRGRMTSGRRNRRGRLGRI